MIDSFAALFWSSSNISSHSCHRSLAFTKIYIHSKCSDVSILCATAIPKYSRVPHSSSNLICAWFIPIFMSSRNPVTHIYFHLVYILMLGWSILFTSNIKQNLICLRFIGALISALPKTDTSSHSTSVSQWLQDSSGYERKSPPTATSVRYWSAICWTLMKCSRMWVQTLIPEGDSVWLHMAAVTAIAGLFPGGAIACWSKPGGDVDYFENCGVGNDCTSL